MSSYFESRHDNDIEIVLNLTQEFVWPALFQL